MFGPKFDLICAKNDLKNKTGDVNVCFVYAGLRLPLSKLGGSTNYYTNQRNSY